MPKGRVPYPFGKCTVCSDQATGNHYGAVTCEGCKGFFKRSLGKSETYRCRGSNNCPVGTDSRIKCKACRFKRCKELGMSMSAIKMGRIPKAEKLRALENAYGDLAAAVAAVAGSSTSSGPSSSVSAHAPTVSSAADSHSPTLSSGQSAAASVASDGASPPTTACASATGVEPIAGATGTAGVLAHFARQPTVVFGNCMTNGTSSTADSALDLSSRPQVADRSSAFDGSRPGAPASGATASRPISVVNNLIAMHVLAMDGVSLRDRSEGTAAASSSRQNSIADSAATGAASQAVGSAVHADAVAASRKVVRCGAPNAAASAVEHRDRWPGVGGDGASSSGSRARTHLRVPSPSAAAEPFAPLPYGASRSITRASQGVAAASSADCISHSLGSRMDRGTPMESSDEFQRHPQDLSGRRSGGQDAHVLPRAIADMLPDRTLNDTVSAVSSAYLKMSSATRRCIDIMSRRLASGQVDAGLLPITVDNQRYAFEQIMVSFDLLGNKIMGFIKSCPGLNALYSEDLLALARSTYLSIWLVLESPLFRDGESHMLLPNGQRHARSWMQFYLPSDLVDRMHAYARAQVTARLTVPELGLMCSILLTSRCKHQPLSDEAAVARLNAIFTQALTYEVHRGRLHPHRILATIWRLLAILQDVNDSHDSLARLRNDSSDSAERSGGSAHSQAA